MRALWIAVAGGKRAVSFISKATIEDLALLTGLCESGELKPVVDRTFPLADARAAFEHFGSHRARDTEPAQSPPLARARYLRGLGISRYLRAVSPVLQRCPSVSGMSART